ncbi:hypothetical protein BV22DRAFT_263777 [Leucogyrophana mollusca]|uniref:Uncharacterized protein n=1 Tax=Leucogyrophana mollusca TaxID=85980 RepID=A0ACB8BQE6_9AGAM|nr:hypothetical protein BV22DRAFT_263777 [Leucogyrophana mollusca]
MLVGIKVLDSPRGERTLEDLAVENMGNINSDDPVLQEHLQIVMYCRLAPVALWAFEYLLTLDDEGRVMWNGCSWNRFHFLFVATRYLPIVALVCLIYETLLPDLAMPACWGLYEGGGWASVLVMTVTEMLLLLRTRILWHCNRTLNAVLIIIFVAALVIIIACYGVIYATGVGSICDLRSSSYHSENEYQVIAGPYWAVAFFESTVIWVTVYHGYCSRASSDGYSGGRLTNALRQGNLVYACFLFVQIPPSFFTRLLMDGADLFLYSSVSCAGRWAHGSLLNYATRCDVENLCLKAKRGPASHHRPLPLGRFRYAAVHPRRTWN